MIRWEQGSGVGTAFPQEAEDSAPSPPGSGASACSPQTGMAWWPGLLRVGGAEAMEWAPQGRGRCLQPPRWSSFACLLLTFPPGAGAPPGLHSLHAAWHACFFPLSVTSLLYLMAPLYFSCFSRLPFSASPHPRSPSEHMRLFSPGCGS